MSPYPTVAKVTMLKYKAEIGERGALVLKAAIS
jgi:hypothetical protein